MENKKSTRENLLEHYKKYPAIQMRDLFKYLYQSAFGCEHMVSSLQGATEYIRRENESREPCGDGEIDLLDGEYARVHLSWLDRGLSAETLAKLFFASAKKETDGEARLKKGLKAALELAEEGLLPFSAGELETAIGQWEALGYPPVHHSEEFRRRYRPAYRVIAVRYLPLLPLLAEIDGKLGASENK